MDRLVYAVEALKPGEEHEWRLLARTDRSFDVQAERACRLGYLSASLHLRLDPEAALGLERAGTDAIVALARTPVETAAECRVKTALFRSWIERARGDRHVASMLRASSGSDAIRLASQHGTVRFAVDGDR